jgi:hypothetical protein
MAVRYAEEHAAEWDAFVDTESRNGTLLHTRRFLSHNPANARDDASLLFRKGERVIGVLPAALVESQGRPTLASHPRSTYGGFVIGRHVGVRAAHTMVHLAVEHARAVGAAAMWVRNPFRIFHASPSDETDYALWACGFGIRSRELEVAVPVAQLAPDEVLAVFDGKTRNQVRKAAKLGVTVRESDDYAAFWAVLEETLRARHGTRPTHSLAEFEMLRSLVGHDEVRLLAAYHEDRLIAGIVVFVANARVLHAQYIASAADAAALCPVNALIAELVAWGARDGYAYVNLGMATEPGGTAVNYGLFEFKEGFGARSILRETMAADVPPISVRADAPAD